MPPTLKIAILFSGGGTTLQNLIDATRDGRLPGVEVALAVGSRETAGGIARCERAGVPCVVVPKRDFPDPVAHTREVFRHLDPEKIGLVCLAGWMSRLVLTEPWLSKRVMNVHPSLLPAFGGPGMYGRRVHEAVLARGCKVTGCTVHYVNNEVDGGEIIAQRPIAVQPDDTADTLAARVQSDERETYLQSVQAHSLKHLRYQPSRSSVLHAVVHIDCRRISGWNTLHTTFQEAFGFPKFYGRNMNAWIDCMGSLDAAEDGLTRVHAPPGGVIVVQLDHSESLKSRAPEVMHAILEDGAFINFRRLQSGDPPNLLISMG